MTNWTKLIGRPELVEGLYERAPSLDGFTLSELCFDVQQNACMMRGTLADFPDNPRPGWEEDANCVAIRLRLEEIDQFELQGWSFENVVDIKIMQIERGRRIRVRAQGDDLCFRMTCATLQAEGIFAYHVIDDDG